MDLDAKCFEKILAFDNFNKFQNFRLNFLPF